MIIISQRVLLVRFSLGSLGSAGLLFGFLDEVEGVSVSDEREIVLAQIKEVAQGATNSFSLFLLLLNLSKSFVTIFNEKGRLSFK